MSVIGPGIGPVFSSSSNSGASAVVAPVGNGANDATTWRTVLDAGLELVLLRRTLYTLTTTLTLQPWDVIHFNGAIVNISVPNVDSVTSAGLLCALSNRGATLTLSADTAIGSRTFSVTAKTNLVIGGEVALAYSAKNCLQAFVITGISGSGPYTITVDRRIRFVFPSASTSVFACTIPRGIRLDGEGATIVAAPTGLDVSIARGFELACLHDGHVEGFLFQGPFVWVGSFDDGSFHSTLRDIRIDASSSYSAVGWAFECNEDCTGEDIALQDVSNNSLGALYVYSGIGNRYRGIRARDCALGLAADTADVFPCDGCTIESSSFDYCGTGLTFSNGSKNWAVTDVSATHSTNNGVLLNTNNSGAPTNNVFTRCSLSSNGGDGVLLVTGAKNRFVDCTISSNANHGVEITGGVTDTSLRGGRIDSNTNYTVYANGDCRIADVYAADNGGEIISTGAALVVVVNSEVSVSSGSALWRAMYNQSTAGMYILGCKIKANGTSGTKIGFAYNAGTSHARGNKFVGTSLTFGILRASGGTLEHDESNDLSGATTPRSGGTATQTDGEVSYG